MRSQKRRRSVCAIEVVEVRVEIALGRARDIASPTQVGTWTPFVMPRIGRSRDAAPGRVGRLGMELADGVRAVRQAQREGGHVELTFGSSSTPRPSSRTRVDRHAAGLRPTVAVEERSRDPPDEVGLEPLVAGRDGRVDREHAVATDLVERRVEGDAGRDELARPLREQERRMALVQVPDGRGDAERAERAHPADAQDELLVEAHLAAADVEDVRDRPVGLGVLRDVGVEQEDRDPADLGDPDGDVRGRDPAAASVTGAARRRGPGRARSSGRRMRS